MNSFAVEIPNCWCAVLKGSEAAARTTEIAAEIALKLRVVIEE